MQNDLTQRTVWLVWATEGEYSDRSEWPVAVCLDQATAEAAVTRMKVLWRSLIAAYKRAEAEAAQQSASDPFWDSPEGRELEALTGAKGYLSGCYADEREYTCCEVNILTAAKLREQTK